MLGKARRKSISSVCGMKGRAGEGDTDGRVLVSLFHVVRVSELV